MKNDVTPISNKRFAEKDNAFAEACRLANCKITTRQASKFRRGSGIAWKVLNNVARPLETGMPGYKANER